MKNMNSRKTTQFPQPAEDTWTTITIRKSTSNKLALLKIWQNLKNLDEVIQGLLKKQENAG